MLEFFRRCFTGMLIALIGWYILFIIALLIKGMWHTFCRIMCCICNCKGD